MLLNPFNSICVSYADVPYEKLYNLIQTVPFAEIRLDKSELDKQQIKRILKKNRNLIVTYHYQEDKETKWFDCITNAITAGAKFVDIGFIEHDEIIEKVKKLLDVHNCTFIFSYHNYETTPSLQYLSDIIDKGFNYGAGIVKIACTVNSYSDTAVLLNLCKDDRPVIITAMGAKGSLLRLLSTDIGTILTFAYDARAEKTAEGQLELNEMQYYYNILHRNKPKLFGVVGNPILHSRSSNIFQFVSKQNNFNILYKKILCQNASEIPLLLQNGFDALNITAPFKNDTKFSFTNNLKEQNQPVNCVINDLGKLRFTNTDCEGVISALRENQIKIKTKRAIVIGSGGAAEAAISGLHREGAYVSVCNRTLSKAQHIANKFHIEYILPEQLPDEITNFDILVNTAECNFIFEDSFVFPPHITILDADYKNAPLKILCLHSSCRYISGLEWLIGQAIPAIRLYTGLEISFQELKTALSKPFEQKKYNRIFLTGMMLSGKTSVGKMLAKRIKYQFIDIDEVIELKTGKSIENIFMDQGEKYFREIETEVLREIMQNDNTVISGGAGIVISEENRQIIKNSAFCIWLFTSPKSAKDRIDQNNTRPLLKQGDKEVIIQKLLKQRIQYYADVSDLVVVNENTEIENIVDAVLREIGISL